MVLGLRAESLGCYIPRCKAAEKFCKDESDEEHYQESNRGTVNTMNMYEFALKRFLRHIVMVTAGLLIFIIWEMAAGWISNGTLNVNTNIFSDWGFIEVAYCLGLGSKHKTMLEARSGAGPIKAYPRPGAKLKNGSSSSLKGSGLQNKTFHCQICDVHVNSEIQLKQVGTAHTL